MNILLKSADEYAGFGFTVESLFVWIDWLYTHYVILKTVS